MTLSMKQLAAKMRKIDICMLGTNAAYGKLGSRPMSNNKDVEYDGTSRFFSWKDSRMVRDIDRDRQVMMTLTDPAGLFVCVQGTASVTTDVEEMCPHWVKDVEQWFKDGVETDGVCMITVNATRITYWSYEDGDGEIIP